MPGSSIHPCRITTVGCPVPVHWTARRWPSTSTSPRTSAPVATGRLTSPQPSAGAAAVGEPPAAGPSVASVAAPSVAGGPEHPDASVTVTAPAPTTCISRFTMCATFGRGPLGLLASSTWAGARSQSLRRAGRGQDDNSVDSIPCRDDDAKEASGDAPGGGRAAREVDRRDDGRGGGRAPDRLVHGRAGAPRAGRDRRGLVGSPTSAAIQTSIEGTFPVADDGRELGCLVSGRRKPGGAVRRGYRRPRDRTLERFTDHRGARRRPDGLHLRSGRPGWQRCRAHPPAHAGRRHRGPPPARGRGRHPAPTRHGRVVGGRVQHLPLRRPVPGRRRGTGDARRPRRQRRHAGRRGARLGQPREPRARRLRRGGTPDGGRPAADTARTRHRRHRRWRSVGRSHRADRLARRQLTTRSDGPARWS